ncbi:protein phosphatase 2C domain-containing protein [Affinibrenneria salicis]|uniref:Protein phosphatase 2C domain-containing protein n=1 Tax=Affinibrenneria salicis TaxID=2590031 RepID=A0A5J5FRA4_9GAMM|nr:PP2C family serine/threonine-protein phosphatase [Affinibrenneria salicis]KAA8995647.1 protein phosphatase 2C domain-containing protein [Affinibrenneria salicis]
MRPWSVYAASATGAAHLERHIPCQDAWSIRRPVGRLIAAVCDGAGSARYSEVGAQTVSRLFTRRLAALAMPEDLPIEQVRPAAVQILTDIRRSLSERAMEQRCEPGEFASTLVAVWIGEQAGYIFHLGDGIAVIETAQGESVISQPENGEYANQTWFLTSDQWEAHLRITPVNAPIGKVILLSDGVQPFAMNKACDALYAPFIEPVLRYLRQVSEEEGSAALQSTLADPRTHRITGDDKTLLICLRDA